MRNKIREFLEKRGVTPYRFGKDVEISQTTAYALVNNPDQLPSSTVLSKICDTYKVQPNDVLVWEEADRTSAPAPIARSQDPNK